MDDRSGEVDSDPDFRAFREKMELQDRIKLQRAEDQSTIKKMQRFVNQSEWRRQIRRTQGYLGLHPVLTIGTGPTDVGLPDIQSLSISDGALKNNTDVSKNNTLEPQCASPEERVFFVSVDVEAFEYAQRLVTEIGISTLATTDILGIQPGIRVSNWARKIHSHHFRIQEHRHLVNKNHVEGCPECFDFGYSRWISIKDAGRVFGEFCNPASPSHPDEPYRFVLVGHDVSADKKYLSNIGLDVEAMFSDCIDTSILYKVSNRDSKQCSLGALLLRYGIAARNLHNAGNDARYTLQVMLAIALDHFQNKKSAEHWEHEKSKRTEAACEVARERVRADLEGWSTSEDDDTKIQPLASTSVGQNEREKTSKVFRGSPGSRRAPNQNQRSLRRKARPKYTSLSEMGDLAVQDNPRFQDPATRPYGESPNTPAGGTVNGDRGRGAGGNRSSRGKNYGHGRGQGRGQ